MSLPHIIHLKFYIKFEIAETYMCLWMSTDQRFQLAHIGTHVFKYEYIVCFIILLKYHQAFVFL